MCRVAIHLVRNVYSEIKKTHNFHQRDSTCWRRVRNMPAPQKTTMMNHLFLLRVFKILIPPRDKYIYTSLLTL